MDETIRVLHVIGSLNIGGSQSLVMSIYRNINHEKIQFDFVINHNEHRYFEKEITDMGGKVYYIPQLNMKNPKKFIDNWHKFFEEHKEYKIIHGHVRSTAAIYLKIARKYGRFAIAHSHNTSSGSGIKAFMKDIIQLPIRYNADYFMACSDEAGKWLFGNKIIKQNNYHVLKNAIELDKFSRKPEIRNEIRDKYNLSDTIVIGNVGRFIKQKNQLFLLDIFSKFHRKNPDSRLLMVGYGEMKKDILTKINELGLKQHAIIPTETEKAEIYLQAMDLYVFPSLYEGLGISLIEAQVSGLPCVISNKVPKSAIVSDYVISLSLNDSIDKWVEKMEYMLQKDTQNICNKDIKSYDINNVVAWIEAFYERNWRN